MKKSSEQTTNSRPEEKVGWRVEEWAHDVGVSRSLVYQFLATKRIASKKVGSARVITTRPEEFLASMPE
jgi:hypothetical protein